MTGIAINGNPELFMLEPEDAGTRYQVDEDSRLTFDGTR